MCQPTSCLFVPFAAVLAAWMIAAGCAGSIEPPPASSDAPPVSEPTVGGSSGTAEPTPEPWADLCRPCEPGDDDACVGSGAAEGARCLDFGDAHFCGSACEADGDCPETHRCEAIDEGTSQCVPVEGACADLVVGDPVGTDPTDDPEDTVGSTTVDDTGDGAGCTEDAECFDDTPCYAATCQDGVCVVGSNDGAKVPCYTGPEGTAGVGVCQSGAAVCAGGVPGPCAAEVLPSTDVCGDGLDNDCDGQADAQCEPVAVDVLDVPAVHRGPIAPGSTTILELTASGLPVGPAPATGTRVDLAP